MVISSKKRDQQVKQTISISDDMHEAFERKVSKGEKLWRDFISTFRPHSIHSWPRGLTCKWCSLLCIRKVHVADGKYVSRADRHTRLWFQGRFIATYNDDMKDNTNDTLQNPGIGHRKELEGRKYSSTAKKGHIAHESLIIPTETRLDILRYTTIGSEIGAEYFRNEDTDMLASTRP